MLNYQRVSSVSFATVPLFSQGHRQDKVHVGDRIIEVNGIAKAMSGGFHQKRHVDDGSFHDIYYPPVI